MTSRDFAGAKAIRDLCDYLDRLSDDSRFPKDRELFSHQAKVFRPDPLRTTEDRPSFVITAGTGRDLPILAALSNEPLRSDEDGCVRSPLRERLSGVWRWLRSCPLLRNRLNPA
jgi:hypothetical protein